MQEQYTENTKNKGIALALWDEYGPTAEFIAGAGIIYANILGLGDAAIELEKQALLSASQLLEIPALYTIPVMSGDDGLLTAGAMAIGALSAFLIGKTANYVIKNKS